MGQKTGTCMTRPWIQRSNTDRDVHESFATENDDDTGMYSGDKSNLPWFLVDVLVEGRDEDKSQDQLIGENDKRARDILTAFYLL